MFALEASFVKSFLFVTKLQNCLYFVKKNFIKIDEKFLFLKLDITLYYY